MATVTKDFRIKSGLVVEGTTGTINGNTILTSADTTSAVDEGTNLYYTNERVDDRVANLVTGGTGITVSYDDNGNAIGISADFAEFSTTDIVEGDKLFFTDERAIAAVGGSATSANTPNTVVKRDGSGNFAAGNVSATQVTVQDAGQIFEDSGLVLQSNSGYGVAILGNQTVDIQSANGDIVLNADGSVYKGSVASTNELATQGRVDQYIGDNTVNGSTGNTIADRIGTVAGDLSTHISDTSTHGVTGDIVGTSDAQTLTNKTMGDDLLMDGFQISGLGTPDQADHAATKAYVDAAVEGLHVHESVRVAVDGNIAIATALENGDTAGGVTLVTGNRVLLKDQSTTSENGIYVVQESGPALRATDFDTAMEVDSGDFVFVSSGTYANTGWVQTLKPAIIGTDPINFTQFSGAGTFLAGNGLTLDGNIFEIDETITATRTFATGEVTTHAGVTTGVHGVTGDVVGTSDTQTLTNKTVSDSLKFSTGLNWSAVYADGNNLKIDGSDDIVLTTNTGDIILNPDGGSYLGSVASGNQIATRGYVNDQTTATIAEDPSATGTSGTMYFTNARAVDALEAVVPNFTSIDINTVAKQIAATVNTSGSINTVAYAFAKEDYRTAKFLVKIASGTHTEASEVLLTLDTSDNIAITEYAVVGTNGPMSTISARIDGTDVELMVTTPNAASVVVTGTLLV